MRRNDGNSFAVSGDENASRQKRKKRLSRVREKASFLF
jgi:hypothetical protein